MVGLSVAGLFVGANDGTLVGGGTGGDPIGAVVPSCAVSTVKSELSLRTTHVLSANIMSRSM